MHVINAVLDSFLQSVSTLQVLSSREALFRRSLSTAGLSSTADLSTNNINAETLKSIEEIAKGVALIHNLVRTEGEAKPT
jgi:hypothetical protein